MGTNAPIVGNREIRWIMWLAVTVAVLRPLPTSSVAVPAATYPNPIEMHGTGTADNPSMTLLDGLGYAR